MKRFFVIFALCCMLVNMIPNAFLSAVPVRAEESGGSGETEGHAYPAEDPGEETEPSEPQAPAEVKVNVNLDAEYFHWKEETQQDDAAGQKPEKHSIFSRRHRGEK